MYVGLDAGTSVVKAVALDHGGALLALASRPTRTLAPAPGRQEQDLEEVIGAAAGAIREVVAATGQAPELIGLTGQGDGVWLLNARGLSVRPPILWSDARSTPILDGWLRSGVVEAVFRRNGNALFPGSAAPILAHLREHEPEALAAATTAAYCDGAIFQRLTGRRQTDASDASLPFLDVRSRHYDDETIALLGLTERRDLLPPVRSGRDAVGALSDDGAALTGLPAGVPVHAGPYDIPATMIGAGITQPGQGLIILGTTLACAVLTDEVRTDGVVAGMTLAMPEPDRWARVMAAMVGTPVLEWVLAMVGAERTELDDLLAASDPGARGVAALPFLSPAGERAPFLDPLATGRADRGQSGVHPGRHRPVGLRGDRPRRPPLPGRGRPDRRRGLPLRRRGAVRPSGARSWPTCSGAPCCWPARRRSARGGPSWPGWPRWASRSTSRPGAGRS